MPLVMRQRICFMQQGQPIWRHTEARLASSYHLSPEALIAATVPAMLPSPALERAPRRVNASSALRKRRLSCLCFRPFCIDVRPSDEASPRRSVWQRLLGVAALLFECWQENLPASQGVCYNPRCILQPCAGFFVTAGPQRVSHAMRKGLPFGRLLGSNSKNGTHIRPCMLDEFGDKEKALRQILA